MLLSVVRTVFSTCTSVRNCIEICSSDRLLVLTWLNTYGVTITCSKYVGDRLLVLDMFIQHVYGVTIPCFHHLHILGFTSEVQSTIQAALSTRLAFSC